MRLEHIGIAIQNDDKASGLFARLFGKNAYKSEAVNSEKVNTTFFGLDNTKIELLSALSEDSTITRFLDKKGEGIHHLAFDVDDINAEIQRLKEQGFIFINETPKEGADNKLICFIHPKSTHGVLVELCQEKP
jgi:methylmalonyl-CoA/ethylmalonyl-CoA epimerase